MRLRDDAWAIGAYEIKVYEPKGLASTFTLADGQRRPGSGQMQARRSRAIPVQQISTKLHADRQLTFADGRACHRRRARFDTNIETLRATPRRPPPADLVSGFVSMMLLPTAGPGDKACGDTIQIFDGKRLYAFDMWSDGVKDVKRGTGGYNGPALHCVASYRRIAGWGDKYLARKSDTKVESYFAPIGKGPNGGPAFYLPVRLWGDAEVGDVVAIPASVTINGKDWGTFFAEGG